jgi:carboxyl-terminal processing protease
MTIERIDGRSVADLIARAQGADERMTDLDAWRRINQALHGADGSIAALAVRLPDGSAREVKAPRSLGAGEIVTLGNLPPLRVAFESHAITTPAGKRAGLIAFNYWMTSINDAFERAIDEFRKADGLVIDLRGNPGGLAGMVGGIAGHVLAEPLLLGTMRTRDGALTFRANPRLVTADARKVTPFAGPVAILVDELTASTSEVFAGALQSLGRARIFGRQSMGQALPALTRQLPNGDVLIHAIGDFVTSTGKSLEGSGVIPDVAVALSPKALADGRDEALDAAIRWIDERRR